MYEVGVVSGFQASHHLVGDFGPASQEHAHAYRVEVAARGRQLQADGTLFDITRLENALGPAIGELDGQNLNVVPGLGQPSAESVARFFAQRIAPALQGAGLDELQVRVWESPEAYAGYAAGLT